MSSIGYPVGKSQLCEFANAHRAEILGTDLPVDGTKMLDATTLATQRISCLNAALKMRSPDQALAYADDLLKWAYRPQ